MIIPANPVQLTSGSLRDQLCKRDRQTIGIQTDSQLDTFTFALRGRHHEPDSLRLQLLVSLIDVIDIETNRTRARSL